MGGALNGTAAAATATTVAAARRILIVGDLALSRGLIRMVLGRLGYVVSCVADGREAATSLAHTRFALVMVALRLPDGAGPAFARRLRQQRADPGAAPRLLLFGDAWDREAVLQECRAAGLDGYLPKPVSIAKLVAAVRELTRPTYDPTAAADGGAALAADLPVPIDLAHLASFADGDEQLERELASLYVATAGRYLAEMRAALAAGAPWDDAAHSLKGASANLGVTEVAALAAAAEKAEPGPEPLARLDEAFARAQRFSRIGAGTWGP
jgi:CheY-like chemotaxis protein